MSRQRLAGGVLVSLIILGVASIGVSQSPPPDPTAPTGRQFTPPWFIANSDVQPDFVFQQTGAIGFDPFVNDFGWSTFIALNWPASSRFNGVPDRQNIIGGTPGKGGEGGGKSKPAGPVVWETFKDTADIYLNPPTVPTPFNSSESIPPACQQIALGNVEASQRTLTMISKTSDVLRDTKQAFTHAPLIDLNSNLVWYEVKVNETYYDYVVSNKYYDSRYQPKSGIDYPAGAADAPGVGAIRVKAAWKIMGGKNSKFPDDPSRFYTTTALIYHPDTQQCSAQQVGLVGLHIVQKTETFPRYTWSTFEHVDNAPTQAEIDDGSAAKKKWNFYNPASNAKPNQPQKNPPYTTPTQVVRVVPINGNPVPANASFRAAMKALRADNVWQNYVLVATQWGGPDFDSGPTQPKFLANTTMETYLQEPIDDPNSPHGCINCHSAFGASKDGDFQLFKAFPKARANDAAIAAASAALPGPR